MGFNPANLDTRAASDAGVWLTLTDIDGNDVFDGEKQPVRFLLAGRDSAVAKEAFGDLTGKTGDTLDAAAQAALAKCVKGWSDNLEGEDGAKLEYSGANTRKLLEIPHIAEWVMAQVLDRANFTTKPSKT